MNGKTESYGRPIEILYEDDSYMVFNKPAGLLVIPTPRNEKNTLVNIVNAQYVSGRDAPKLYPCHRLDRETSGVILFAKGKRRQQWMMELFKKRAIRKKYIACVYGKLPQRQGEIRFSVADRALRKFRGRPSLKSAVTRYRVIEVKKRFSVVEVEPLTGRKNQIRIHFTQIGHPLVGERKYAFARDYPLKFKRVALHAAGLEWMHPVNHSRVKVTADLADDMEAFIARN